MNFTSRITLKPQYFKEKETTFAETEDMHVSLFRYNSGVCGLRLSNLNGSLILLPFQGQQIWSATFDNRSLKMSSIFDEPAPTQEYLKNYGGFFIHCGLTGIGNPAPDDPHPLHGELPNAPYKEACLKIGTDKIGNYMELKGSYDYKRAFSYNYIAQPSVRLYANATTVQISMEISNLSSKPLEYMYLAHINFSLVENSAIFTTANERADDVTIRKQVISEFEANEPYRRFFQKVSENPAILNNITPELILDPELVAFYTYKSDEMGWAHSLQCHPDGYASYVKHRPSELEHVTRWMVRTEDEQALGLALPATAQPEGYAAEKKKNNIKILPPKGKIGFAMEAGITRPEQTSVIREKIRQVKNSEI
ncbi:DUF4432 family protein [Aneurinibacillus sp. REN35]|uniref:DUF4432 family protein n=1 Tax=Aneurinibacillus sp. REN35 TaxID=3237286 RepID=UPI0035291C50